MAQKVFSATGRRKTSVARVFLKEGTGNVSINDRALDEYFGRETARMIVLQPFRVTQTVGNYDAEVNVVGSLNVLQGALAAGARKVVFMASGGTLYGMPEDLPTKEGHPHQPVCPYGVAKKAVVDYLRYYREVQGLEYTALAPSNIYGPRQDPHGEAGVIAIFAAKLFAGDRPTIYGDGEQTRDFVYVDDVVDAAMRAVDRADGLLVNIGTGEETSVQRVYDAMAGLVGFDEPARYGGARQGDVRRSCLDPGRAAIHLGWKPFTTLDDGLRQTLDWFRHRASA